MYLFLLDMIDLNWRLSSFLLILLFFFAGAALVNFSEDCPKTILAPYLDGIMAKLEAILSAKFSLAEKGNKLVLEQIVTTLASVADTAEEKFGAYYDRFVPGLKNIIQNANTPELRLLRGKTIECIR